MPSQNQIITALNRYCNYHQLSISYNKRGICYGLCSLRSKYILQNKEHRFQEIIVELADLRPSQDLSEEQQLFMLELMLAANPRQFSSQFNYEDALRLIYKQQNASKPSFKISLITNATNWLEILKQINIQPGEAVTIRSGNHIISVFKKNNLYSFYDPNTGFAVYDNEQKLLDRLLELKTFGINSRDTIAFTLDIRSNSSPTTQPQHRAVENIYAAYLNPNLKSTTYRGKSINTLDLAIRDGLEFAVIKQLITLGCSADKQLLETAIINHASAEVFRELFKLFYPENNNLEDLEFFLCTAIACDSEKIFDLFYDSDFFHAFLCRNTAVTIFSLAFVTKGHVIFNKILPLFQQSLSEESRREIMVIFFKTLKIDAERPVNFQNLRLLLNEAHNLGCQASPEQTLKFLSMAIQSNDYPVVKQWLDSEFIPSTYIKDLNLPLSLVKKINAPILRLLESKGVKFSNNAKSIIAQKEHHWVNIVRLILILIEQLTDYLRSRKDLSFFTPKMSAPTPINEDIPATKSHNV